MQKYYASDILGQDSFDALLASDTNASEIKKQASERFEGVKQMLGEERFKQIREAGYDFNKIEEVAHYVRDTAKKKAEDKKYKEDVEFKRKDYIAKDKGTTPFENALENNLARFSSFINPINPTTGDKVDPHWAGIQQAMPELEEKYKKSKLSSVDYAEYLQDQKDTENADGVWNKLGAVGKDMYHRVQSPSAINVPAAFGDMFTPENLIAGPAGSLGVKLGGTLGTKLLSAGVVGTAADGVGNYGYEYGVQKGLGNSNKDAHEAGAVTALAGVVPGAVVSTLGGGMKLASKGKQDVSVQETNGVDPTQTKQETTHNLDGAKELNDEVEANSFTNLTSEDDLLSSFEKEFKNTSLMQEEAVVHSTEAIKAIKEIEASTPDLAKREALVAKYVPPSEMEASFNMDFNGKEVAPSVYGTRAREKLVGTLEHADKYDVEMVKTKLDNYGLGEEHKAVILDAYAQRDIKIYDAWADAKIEGAVNERVATRDGGEDTPQQEGRVGGESVGVGEAINTNKQFEELPNTEPRGTEVNEATGRNIGDVYTENGLSQGSSGMDGQPTFNPNDGDVPRTTRNELVQEKASVLTSTQEGVASSIVERAKGRVGTPYVWGGRDLQKGADCSGFIQSLYAEKGIKLPRTAWLQSQSKQGGSVAFKDLKVGDSVYFKPSATGKKYAPVTHTGLITGFTDKGVPIMTHAKGKKFGTVTEPMSLAYQNRFYNAKRFAGDQVENADALPEMKNTFEEDIELLRQEADDAEFALKDEPFQIDVDNPTTRGDGTGDAFDVDALGQSDGMVETPGGFKLKHFPNRLKVLEPMTIPTSTTRKAVKFAEGKVDAELASHFSMKNPESVSRMMSASSVRHALKKHGDADAEATRGQYAVTLDDIANYPEITQKYSMRVFGKNDRNNPIVISARQKKGHFVVVEEVSGGKNRLTFNNMWKGKGEATEAALMAYLDKPPRSTSKTQTSVGSKSIAKDTDNIKSIGDLTSHRYYDDVVNAVEGQRVKNETRPTRTRHSDLKMQLEKKGWDKSDDRYKAEMQKLFKASKENRAEGDFSHYTKTEIKNIRSGKIDRPLAQKLRADLKEYAANPKWAKYREDVDLGIRAFSEEVDILKEMKADEALGLVESATFREAFDTPLKVDDMVKGIDDHLLEGRKKVEGENLVKGMRSGFIAVNPIETIFIDIPAVFNNMKNKLDKIVSDKVTGKIKDTKFDDFMRKYLLADMNGFGGLSRKQSESLVKQFRKLQAGLAKSNINAEQKATLVSGFKKEMKDNLFHSITIRYLENPKIRKAIRENMPEMAKQLDIVKDTISKNSKELMSRGLLLPSQYAKWRDNFLSRLYMVEADSKGINISNGVKQAEIKSGRKIDSIIDYLQQYPAEAKRLNVVLDSELMIKTTIAKGEGNVAIDDFFRGIIAMPDTVDNALLVKLPGKINNLPDEFSPTYAEKVVVPYIDDLMNIENKKMADGLFTKEPIKIAAEKEFARLKEMKKDIQEQIGVTRYLVDNADLKKKVKIPADKRYGVLSGLPIEQDIASMVKSQFNILHEPEMFANRLDKYGSQFLAYFKWAKVPANIFAYPRNLQGNFFQWSMSGANPTSFFKEYPSAIVSMLEKDKWYKMAQEHGLLNTNVMSEEVNNTLRGVADSIKGNSKSEKAHKSLLAAMQKVGDAYGLVDDIAKVARMRYAIEKEGVSISDAVNKAQETHFDYSLTPDLVRKMRNPDMTEGSVLKIIGTLFPTYTQKTIAYLYDTIIHRPVTLASISLGLSIYLKGNQDETRERIGAERYDEIMDNMPSYVKNNPFNRIEMKEVDGKIEVTIIDLGYTIPFGSVVTAGYNMLRGEFAQAAGGLGLGGSPIQMVGDLVNNKDSFTGKEIYFDADGVQKTKDLFSYFAKQLAPGTVTKLYSLSETKHPVIPRVVGINTYAYTAEELAKYNGYSKQKQKTQAGRRAVKYKRKIEQAYKKYKNGEMSHEKYLEIKKVNEAEIKRWKALGEKEN